MKKPKFTNRLAEETSPYLLQHAHNPVDWFPWGNEALEKAQLEDKPILVSIGYSSCHWCHVMERESFEDEQIAQFMNEHFINIKIDREERPDIDQIYMDALQIMTGGGGWPLNCFLTPNGLPFYGGTYFPPFPRYNLPSWMQVLVSLERSYRERRDEIETRAKNLKKYIEKSDKSFLNKEDSLVTTENSTDEDLLHKIYINLSDKMDDQEGGFGGAPKFPGTMSLQYLLSYHYYTGNERAINHVRLSLDKMIKGGIYDQLGGGFSRYAVDREWLVPHFEKMLYDNALLVSLLSDFYKIKPNPSYREAIQETIDFLKREMQHPHGGFYAALDADSEGVEGKFYVWEKEEVEKTLGTFGKSFCDFYNITTSGNWEGKNILNRTLFVEAYCNENQIENCNYFKSELTKAKDKLLQLRAKRIRPELDDKILLSWNALMISALVRAYEALNDPEYLQLAKNTLDFLLKNFQLGEEEFPLGHSYKNRVNPQPGFLEDYAYLVQALLDVYFNTFDLQLLSCAERCIEYVFEEFYDETSGLFFYTSKSQKALIVRKKEIYDTAIPSGNAIMVKNLQQMGVLSNRSEWSERASKNLKQMKGAITAYSTTFSQWAISLQDLIKGLPEIAILGKNFKTLAKEINQEFIPGKIIMGHDSALETYPLLNRKTPADKTLIFLCHHYSCQLPVDTSEDLLKRLRNKTYL